MDLIFQCHNCHNFIPGQIKPCTMSCIIILHTKFQHTVHIRFKISVQSLIYRSLLDPSVIGNSGLEESISR